jgi:hypothetical protein
MDWSAVGSLIGPMAPTIGSILGGFIPFPGGAVLGSLAGKMVASALGVPPTPEAVHEAVTTGDPDVIKAKLASADAEMNAEVEKHKADLADVADARSTNLELMKAGSKISYAPVVVSVVILSGFLILSFLAMRPDLAGVRTDVTLYLLGAWSTFAGAVVTYWLGSSAGSVDKSAQIAVLAGAATKAAPTPIIKKK